ncbi:hypothetical protein RUM43_006322 [Polyplax serrata]|uniref:Zinc/cadmium resistance protein n=1 Tax=Polyplax serrata TaxID=468196 RepID=A0AAN8S228_POLSC
MVTKYPAYKKLHYGDIQGERKKEIGPKTTKEPNDSTQQVTKSVRESESSLKNTFGWARIDILVMLIGCIFLASLGFSVLVEAVQTLIHIDHHDEMHFPLVIVMVGAVGLLLNGFCYILIGGYTFHQGSYLHVTENGEVVLERAVTVDSLRKGQRRLSSQSRRTTLTYSPPQRQGIREMIRDIIGCIYVILCGLVVYFTTGHQFAKYLDPLISIVSATSLLSLSYPYMKESGLILLQTIPDDINIDSLRFQLLQAFPNVVNVHDLHVWQLTADKIISTAHIIFLNPADYLKINKQMTKFFNDQGITQVTIQPEFAIESGPNSMSPDIQGSQTAPCLMQCTTDECRKRNCCIEPKDSRSDECLEVIKIEGNSSSSNTSPSTSTSEPTRTLAEPKQKKQEPSQKKSKLTNQK